LEEKKLIKGRWVEPSGGPRRRDYRLSAKGRKFLEAERDTWKAYVSAVNRIIGVKHA
jgi:PadR family transcriptional regulator PadR